MTRAPHPLPTPGGLSIAGVARALQDHAPVTEASERAARRAAVALILRDGPAGGLETLFIQRAEHPQDPWSGHMAFPGGRVDPGDPSIEAAARRETLEEVGLELVPGQLIGRLSDLGGGRLSAFDLSVSPFVYRLDEPAAPLVLSDEVADVVWVPLEFMANPANVSPYYYPPDPTRRRFPAFRYDKYTIWGMTFRMMGDFLRLLGVDLPDEGEMTEVE